MPPTETPDPKAEAQEGYPPPTDVTYDARMKWPYLGGWHAGGGIPQNGRELGCWIAGHATGRRMHGEPGLRVQISEKHVAGCVAVLLEYGLIVQRHSTADGPAAGGERLITIDVWAY